MVSILWPLSLCVQKVWKWMLCVCVSVHLNTIMWLNKLLISHYLEFLSVSSSAVFCVHRTRGLSTHGVAMDTLCVHRGSNPIQRPQELPRGPVSPICCTLVSQCLLSKIEANGWLVRHPLAEASFFPQFPIDQAINECSINVPWSNIKPSYSQTNW